MDLRNIIGSRIHSNAKLKLSSHVQVQMVQSLRQYSPHRFSRRERLCPNWQFDIGWLDFEAMGPRSQASMGNRTCAAPFLPLWSDLSLLSVFKTQHGSGHLETRVSRPAGFVPQFPPSRVPLMLQAQLTAGSSRLMFSPPFHLARPSPRFPLIPMPPPITKDGLKCFLSPVPVFKSLLGQRRSEIGFLDLQILQRWQTLRTR